MPRKAGKHYPKRPKQPKTDALSIDERALLKAIAPGAIPRKALRKEVRATAPFAGPEIRAKKIAELISKNETELTNVIQIRVSHAIYLRVKELADLQERPLSEIAASLLWRGLANSGLTFDRRRVEDAVRRFLRDVLFDETVDPESEDPFAEIVGETLGRGLAAEIKRSRR